MDGTQFPYLMHQLVKKLSGQNLTLLAGAARTVDSNGAAVKVGGHRRLIVMLDVTAFGGANVAGDKLDVLIDFLAPDGATWLPAGHFTQIDGNGSAAKEFMVFVAENPGTATFNVTSDPTEGVVRPALFGSSVRARVDITNGGGDHSFTFSVTAYGE